MRLLGWGFELVSSEATDASRAGAPGSDRSADTSFRTKGTHGGSRVGAGRPKKKDRKDPHHTTRPEFARRYPRHVVLRTLADVPRLRRGKIYRALRRPLARMLGDLGFRIVHLSIQHNHLHLLVEAGGKDALRRGMQGFAISAAKAINKVLKRKGKVFAFRYHATPITSPTQARHALSYVLNNWRRHNEDERTRAAQEAALDPYSTARLFTGWKESARAVMPAGFERWDALEVAPASTWLLTVGWRKGGGEISLFAAPGPLPAKRRRN